jgi:Flp pilus assembly protein TadG
MPKEYLRRHGAILPMFVIVLPVMLLICMVAINLAHLQLTETELKVATDASAQAAGRAWSEFQDETIARDYARLAAASNTVSGSTVTLADSEIIFGKSLTHPTGRYQFDENLSGGDLASAVRVTADFPTPLLFQVSNLSSVTLNKSSVVSQVDRDIALVIDRSESMLTADADWSGDPDLQTRWDLLLNASQTFFDVLDETDHVEMVSISSFSSTASNDLALTSNNTACYQEVLAMTPEGNTAIGDGLLESLQSLLTPMARPNAQKTIIIFTDGVSNIGTDVSVAINYLRQNHPEVTCHTVTFTSGADQAAMRSLANQANGKHYHADTGDQLDDIFRELAASFKTIVTE